MKRTLHCTLLAALAVGVSTVSLFAQAPAGSPPPGGPPPGHHGPPPPSPLIGALDANHDGVISADEIANAPAALKALAGSSGQITKESLRPSHHPEDGGPNAADGDAGGPPHHGPGMHEHAQKDNGAKSTTDAEANGTPAGSPPPGGHPHHGPPGMLVFDALDTNHDGVISANEIANASASLKALDKNGDGQLTPDELHPHGPPPPPPAPASN